MGVQSQGEGEGWTEREGAASVQLACRTQILQAQVSGRPFLQGTGKVYVYSGHDLPSWLLQAPGRFLTPSFQGRMEPVGPGLELAER